MRFSLDHIEAFTAAVETGSFSAAGRRLGKAQSRISTAIADLEADLGVVLFDRSGKYPILTRDGDLLLRRAEEVLKQCRELEGRADQLAEGRQVELRIAVDELLPPKVTAEALSRFAKAFPDIELEVLWGAMGDVADIVRSGRADVGIDMPVEPQPPADCSWQVLADTDFCGTAAPDHPLARLRTITEDDLRPHLQLLAISRGGNTLPNSFRLGDGVWQCEDSSLIRELVRRGLGWAALARHQIAEDLRRGTLVELPLSLGECGLCNTFFFIRALHRPLTEAEKRLAEEFARVLHEVCAV